MPDRYSNFAELAARETEDVHYRICAFDRPSPVVIFAPHGGHIEPGTSELAAAIAGQLFSLYQFEGVVPGRPHRDLHIASERFDEPVGRRLVAASELVIGVHGRANEDDENTIWLGGLDEKLRDGVADALKEVDFACRTTGHRLPGRDRHNICNVGRRKAGVQLEPPRTLRDALTLDTLQMELFATAVRQAIESHVAEW